jgi:hypothetical protein
MPVSMFHTSVPRWTAEFTAPERATRVVVVAGSPTETLARVLAELGCPGDVYPPGDLGPVLENARVGWHFVLVGTDAEVAAVRAQVLAAGAIDAEITEVVDDSAQRRVYCTHCRQLTTAAVAVGATVDCAGCAAPLVVYYHFSRRLGAYLGYRVDSEELP